MIATYLRTILTITFDCGVVPLGPLAIERRRSKSKKGQDPQRSGDPESYPYYAGPDPDPDSPGLEQFYTKDVFVCESDGRPKWCSECCNWKPDRAHHSSEVNRCVYRMDHYCPWVGGMIGENCELRQATRIITRCNQTDKLTNRSLQVFCPVHCICLVLWRIGDCLDRLVYRDTIPQRALSKG